MGNTDNKLLRIFFEELQEKIDNDLHIRILEAAIDRDDAFLTAMEKELGDYLVKVLKNEN